MYSLIRIYVCSKRLRDDILCILASFCDDVIRSYAILFDDLMNDSNNDPIPKIWKQTMWTGKYNIICFSQLSKVLKINAAKIRHEIILVNFNLQCDK